MRAAELNELVLSTLVELGPVYTEGAKLLAEFLDVPIGRVYRALRALESAGAISRESGGGGGHGRSAQVIEVKPARTAPVVFAGVQDYEPGDVASVDWSDVPLGLTSDQTIAHYLGLPIHVISAARTQRRIRVFSRAPRAEMPTYADALAKMVRMNNGGYEMERELPTTAPTADDEFASWLDDMREAAERMQTIDPELYRRVMARVSDPTVLRAAFDAGWKAARA